MMVLPDDETLCLYIQPFYGVREWPTDGACESLFIWWCDKAIGLNRDNQKKEQSQECKNQPRHCFLCLVTLTFWPQNNGFSGLMVEHFCVKFGDSSCIDFLRCHEEKQTENPIRRRLPSAWDFWRGLRICPRLFCLFVCLFVYNIHVSTITQKVIGWF